MSAAAPLLALALALPVLALPAEAAQPYDLLFVGGEVIDGTGAPRFRADVAVEGDRIAAIGHLRGAQATQTVDIAGKVLSPGFIDPYTNFVAGEAAGVTHENAVQQGITTTGISVEGGHVDKQEERRALERQGTAVNLAPFFPFSEAYAEVVGDGEPTPDKVAQVKALARKAMEDGAFGVGAGMAYCPSCRAPTEVFIEVAREAKPFGGHFTAHIRNEDAMVLDATAELIAIAEGAGVPGVVHHMKVAGPPQCGIAAQTTGLVRAAQGRGADISANAYPYSAGFTTDLGLFIPDEHEEGSELDRQLRWRSPATRPQVVAAIEGGISNLTGSAEKVYFPVHRTTLAQEAQLRRVSPGEAVLQMVENKEVRPYVLHFGCDEDLRTILTQPWTSFLTDGQPWAGPHEAYVGHPRVYGTYPRILGTYARDEGWFSLEEAVRKSTGQPAHRLGLHHAQRGLVKEGWAADLVVFDPRAVTDKATYEEAGRFSVGIAWVLVNGAPLLRDGALAPLPERAAAPPGRILAHTAEMPSEPQPGYDLRATPSAPPPPPARGAPGLESLTLIAVAACLAIGLRNIGRR